MELGKSQKELSRILEGFGYERNTVKLILILLQGPENCTKMVQWLKSLSGDPTTDEIAKQIQSLMVPAEEQTNNCE